MAENKKLVPKRRFKEIQNTDAWEQRKLGEVYQKIRNAFVGTATPYYVDVGHFYLESNNVKDGQINKNSEIFINDEFYERQKDNWLHTNDLVMVQSGHVGHIAVIPENLDNTAAHALIIIANPREKINPHFISYQFQTKKVKSDIDNITTGNTIKHILSSEMKKFEVFVCDYEEQTHIGEFFKHLDNFITLHQRKLEKTKALKAAFLSEMFPAEGEREPRRRFAGFTDVWEQRKLGDMGKTFTGLSGKTKEDFGHGDAKFITYMNVFNNPIADRNGTESVEIDDKQSEVKYGDVLFTTSSETPEEVGMSSIWLENTANVYLNSFCFGYRPTTEFDLYYFGFMLRSPAVRKKFMFLAQGISRYNISKNKVMDMCVPVPNLDEQVKIGQFFSELDNLISLHQLKIEKLKDIKKAYLNEMFI